MDRARREAERQGVPKRAPPFHLRECDQGSVESGLQAPRASFGDVERYLDLPTKAAVLALAFARFQRCPDGNKRLALILLFTFLAMNGYRLAAEQEELARVILEGATASSDEVALGNLATWIGAHVTLATE